LALHNTDTHLVSHVTDQHFGDGELGSDLPRSRTGQPAIGIQGRADCIWETFRHGTFRYLGGLPAFGMTRIAKQAELTVIEAYTQCIGGLTNDEWRDLSRFRNRKSLSTRQFSILGTRFYRRGECSIYHEIGGQLLFLHDVLLKNSYVIFREGWYGNMTVSFDHILV